MHVIGHHAPRQQFVTLVVKVNQRLLRNAGDELIPQPTCANAAIQIFLQPGPFLALVLDGQQVFPFAAARGGHGVFQPKGDELDQVRKTAVREITALVPAEETEFALRVCELSAAPLIPRPDQFEEVFPF